jgi:hypothetical protein
MHALTTSAEAGNVVTTSVKRAKSIATFQYIPGTSSNTATISDPPSTTPSSQGWLFDSQSSGSYANASWNITLLLQENTAAGTINCEAQIFVVTTNGTSVTKVSQIGGLASTGTYTPSSGNNVKSLSIASPGVITLAAGQYIYLELYLKQTVSAGSNTAVSQLTEDHSTYSYFVTPDFTPEVDAIATPSGVSVTEEIGTVQFRTAFPVGIAETVTIGTRSERNPISDIASGSWSIIGASSYFGAISESIANDSMYIYSSVAPSNDTVTVKLVPQSGSSAPTGNPTIVIRSRLATLSTISFVDTVTTDLTDGSDNFIILAPPSGVQYGDVLIAVIQVESDQSGDSYTPPAGWTLLAHVEDIPSANVWWAIAPVSDYTFHSDVSNGPFHGCILAYRGADPTAPVQAPYGFQLNLSGTFIEDGETQDITTDRNNSWGVCIFSWGDSGSTFSDDSPLRYRITSEGPSSAIHVADFATTTAGAQGDQFTHYGVAAYSYNIVFALRAVFG